MSDAGTVSEHLGRAAVAQAVDSVDIAEAGRVAVLLEVFAQNLRSEERFF